MSVIGKLCLFLENRIHLYKQVMYSQQVNNSGGGVISGLCLIKHAENIYIGHNSFINGGCIFASPNATIRIGDNCLISYNVHIRTDMHNYIDKDTLIREQGETEKSISIGNDVWIGFGAQIMAGVTITDGCVIGAGAIVTKDTEKYGVYVGIPAKLIKYRE